MNESTSLLKLISLAEQYLEENECAPGDEPDHIRDARQAIEITKGMLRNDNLVPATVLVSIASSVTSVFTEGNVIAQVVDWDTHETNDQPPVLPHFFRDLMLHGFTDRQFSFDDQNTMLNLSYVCNDSRTASEPVVVRGAITPAQLKAVSQATNGLIIASQVGLPTPSEQLQGEDNWPASEVDSVFTSIEGFKRDAYVIASDMHTVELPTIDLDIDDVIQQILAVSEWDQAAEWARLRALK